MSRETLRTIGVINAWDTAKLAARSGGVGVYLDYRPGSSRPFVDAGWVVVRPGYQTDPNAHWTDRGNKVFSTFRHGADRAAALAAAQEWAGARYGVTEWGKISGLGAAQFPAGDVAIIKAALKAAKEKS